MKPTDNKKPLTNVDDLAVNTFERGSKITMDENSIHRTRISRFGHLKQQSKDMSKWLFAMSHEARALNTPIAEKMAHRLFHHASLLSGCANWMLFKHYYTLGQYKLDKFISCKKHMLCPFCSALRASKSAKAHHDKMLTILKDKPHLKAVFITVTVKNGDDLLERFEHLENSFQVLKDRRRDSRKKGRGFCEFSKIDGCVYSYEITNKGNGWHPHIHMVALVDDWIDREKLSKEWKAITGDSFIVDVRRLKPTKADLSLNVGEQSSNEGDYMEAFMEVFKYALKFSDMSFENIWLAHETLTKEKVSDDGSIKTRMRKLQGTIGSFRGVKVPEKLTDEPIEDNAPFMAILYRYLGSAYSVTEMQDFPHGQVSNENMAIALEDLLSSGETLPTIHAVMPADALTTTTTRRSCDDVEEEKDRRWHELKALPDWLLVFEPDKEILKE